MNRCKNSINSHFPSRSMGWVFITSLVVLLLLASPPSVWAQPGGYGFGDAPDSPYPTQLTNNGARHFVSPLYMGYAA